MIKHPKSGEIYIISYNEIYYINENSVAEKIFEGDVRDFYHKEDNLIFYEFNNEAFSCDLYELKGNKAKKLVDEAYSISLREDGKGFSFLDENRWLYTYYKGEVKNVIKEKVSTFRNAPYSNDVYFTVYGNLDGLVYKYTDGKGVEVIANTLVKDFDVLGEGDEAYFIGSNNELYYYNDSHGVEILAKNCLSFSTSNTGNLIYQDRDTIYYRNKKGITRSLYKIPKWIPNEWGENGDMLSEIVVDLENKMLYHQINERLYAISLTTGDELREVSENSYMMYYDDYEGEKNYGNIRIIFSTIYGYVSEVSFIPITKYMPYGDVNNKIKIVLYNKYDVEDGIIIGEPQNKSDELANLYYIEQGKAPVLVDENTKRYMPVVWYSYGDCFPYLIKSSNNPGKYSLYVTNGRSKVKVLEDVSEVFSIDF